MDSSWDDDSTLTDCALAADSFAQHVAEQEREYNDAWQAARQWQELGETMAATRQEARQLVKAMRAAIREGLEAAPVLCAALRKQLRALLNQWEGQRQERDKLDSDFWYYQDSKSLRIAQFAESHL
jgi:hypothetical protein